MRIIVIKKRVKLMRQSKNKLTRLYLKQLIEDSGLSTAEFADNIGISLPYLMILSNDTKTISFESLVKVYIKVFELTHIAVTELMLRETDYQMKKYEIEKLNDSSADESVSKNTVVTSENLVVKWIKDSLSCDMIYDKMIKETEKQLKKLSRGE